MYSFYIGEKITSFSLNTYIYIITKILIYMKVKQLLTGKLHKAAAILGLSLISFTSQAQVNVTVENLASTDPLSMWRSYRNVFENNGAFENSQDLAYIFGDQYVSFDDLKSIFDATASTIALYPNYSLYNATDTYWANGENGNKIFEGLTFVERTDMAGQTLVFSGHTVSSTLVAGYHDTAFIKVIDPANNYATVYTDIVDLTAGEDFTLSTGNFTVTTGQLVQYGFSVIGLNGNPAQQTANGFTVVTSAEPGDVDNPTDATVSIDTTSPIIAFANWFELDGTTYVGGNTWGIADLKTVLNTTDNTIDLHPNFSAYANEVATTPDATYWHNGAVGAKVFEGNTYIDDATLLGQTITFEGHCISNTLADGYDGIAFIKVLDSNYQLVNYTHVPLVGGQDFTITVGPDDYANGAHFQYGYSVTGVNANPEQEAALGFARVGQATAGVADLNKKTVVMYPNPASNVLNITAQNNIDGVQVFNMVGQKVIDAKPNQTNTVINVAGLNAGVYIINTTVNGKQDSARFIKQ